MSCPSSTSNSDRWCPRGRLVVILVLWALGLGACRSRPEVLSSPFTDTFDAPFLGKHWHDTIGRYTVIDGRLNISGGYNHPLWLKYPLPVDVDVEFDAMSLTKDGDIKVELFGDGHSYAFNRGAYVATGYVLCMGGWGNTKTFIARQAEHAKNLLFTLKEKVEIGKMHHFRIESRREGKDLVINWFIDSKQVLSMRDRHPLYGPRNRWFGFTNWASDVWFDNLKIIPVGRTP